jgi:hypothetical protein
MPSYFYRDEQARSMQVRSEYSGDLDLLFSLIEVIDECLNRLGGKVVIGHDPDHAILLLCAQNLSLINNATSLFELGYVREPLILLRTVSEQIILAMFFKENPGKASEFRTVDHREFYQDNRIEKMLSSIDREGKVFKRKEDPGYNYWNRIVYKDLFEQLSVFSHVNLDAIEEYMFDQDTDSYVKGPRKFPNSRMKQIMRIHFSAALITVLILTTTFSIELTGKELQAVKDSIERANGPLNVKMDAS